MLSLTVTKLLALLLTLWSSNAFTVGSNKSKTSSSPITALNMDRRTLFSSTATTTAALLLLFQTTTVLPAFAKTVPTLEDYLYRIVRVREATYQERRLIQSGKFKDMQRANVKLAVKFMVQNYRLSDAVVGASAYLQSGNSAGLKALEVGQAGVQSLVTILEYFDASDVENIKVGGANSMAGKETLVLKGLEAASERLDSFVTYFPPEVVAKVKAQIQKENELNVKEFDPTLRDIINLPPPSESVKL